MSVRTLEVDGKTITALEGQTIFAAAWEAGIRIPRLCHLGGLSDVGACRLCLVEIEGQKKLQPSCLTKVTEEMVVRTETPKLRAQRKLIRIVVRGAQPCLLGLRAGYGVRTAEPRGAFGRRSHSAATAGAEALSGREP